jgi:hypothetical protein
VAFLAGLIGALIPTFLLSRLALWLLNRWQGGSPRLVVANLASWVVLAVVGGFLMGYGQRITFEAAQVYALPQLIWLALDLMLLRRALAPEPRI